MQLSHKAVERVSEVFQRVDLNDKRLERRACALAEALAAKPNVSLPQAWSISAVREAGYEFLRNTRTEFSALMNAVQQATREQAVNEPCVLVLHDTTEVACPAADPEEVGFLPTGKAGFFVHHSLCVLPNRIPLGMLWSDAWGRSERSKGRKPKATGSELAKLEERESDRWLEGISEAHMWAEGCEQVVHVMDREADSFRVFEHLQILSADFVVRLRHDRRIDDGHLCTELAASPIRMHRNIAVSARKQKTAPRTSHTERAARKAEISVRCSQVRIQPPKYMPMAAEIELNVVQVLEEKPPHGAEPVAWVIATSLPVKTRAELERVIDIYRARWVIEEFHKALKTGCLLEKRQLQSFESITTLLALSYPIATELLRFRSRAREPGLPASTVLRPSLLACLRLHPNAGKLSANPSVEEALNVIAALGGHIKWNGAPGWQTLAAGYKEILAFERGWLAASGARKM
jgi:hypothetical protein